ncbi:MAG: discoidin domain-containing protein, partial [Planctomycetota bacterium]
SLDSLKGKDPMQDAFAIESVKSDGRQVVLMIGTTARSVIYAQYAFLETLAREGGKVFYPDMSVRDWSGLRYRDWWPGSPSYFATIPYALDQVTYARPNMTQFRTFKSAEVSKDLVKECWRRGMRPYGVINGAIRRDGHPYAVQETKAWLEKGCYGIYVSFDDFGMGEDPEGLCGKVTDVIKKHFGKVGDHIAVIAGADYDYLSSRNNRRMSKFKDFDEAIFYITGPPHGVFSTKRHYDDARAVGIKNYVWWHNFAMGATGFYAPVRKRRYFPQLPFNQKCWGRFTFDDLRQGDKHMTGYCAQNDGWDIAAIQLFWAWDPVHYDYEKARTAIYRQRHGDAAVEAVRKLDDNMYKLTEYYRLMWRHYAMTAWPLRDVSKRKEVLALIEEMQQQVQAVKAGKKVSYLSDEGYDEHFVEPLEAHLDAAKRLASLDFPDYAVQRREGFNTRGGANLLKAWAALSLRTKMVRLLSAGKTREAEAYLAALRKEALPMLKVIETELKDLWYTKEYVDGWRSMLEPNYWEPVAREAFNKGIWLNIRRNAEGLVVMESGAENCEILFTLDGPPPAVGAAEIYNGPRSLPGSHIVRAVVRQKAFGMTSRVFEHYLGLPKTGWKVAYVDSEGGRGNVAANLIDGNPATLWMTEQENKKPRHPHEVQIDLGKETAIQSIGLCPDMKIRAGTPSEYKAYVSADGKDWGNPVAAGKFGKIEKVMMIALKERTHARFIRLVFLSDFWSVHFSSVGEVDVFDFPHRPVAGP